ncbi:disease resistance protein RPM1-like [Magnolia sinica]|uniref:disease resistance protein RPM1-like n=1 Tax=Magnolia sinica TaxID=86752 RepID=UPI00265960E3|nr:disease resistance protein RPM1-like [Magnolia sinica]
MLQVVETNEFGRVKPCQMHDIVREVALSLSDEEKFCMIYDEKQARQESKVRRMSIYSSGEIIQSTAGELKLGSFPNLYGSYRTFKHWIVGNTKLERLPSGIVKLQKLRHLYIYRITDEFYNDFDYLSSIQIPIRICNLISLQTLRDIEDKEGEIVRKVGNLTQLRNLSISKVREIDGAELCNSIGKMKHLLKLTVRATGEEEILQLEALSPNTPPLLQKLYLKGRLEKVPRWLSSVVNLTHLSLNWSKLGEEDPLSSLQALPNLMYLCLQRAYEGQQLYFGDGRFTKLRVLYLRDMKQLNRIVIEKGALASIPELILINCGELKTLPEGIEYLTGLQQFLLGDMPTELTDRLKLKDGSEEDRRKVGHIPFILRGQRTEADGLITERLN